VNPRLPILRVVNPRLPILRVVNFRHPILRVVNFRHPILRVVNPRVLNDMTFYDVAPAIRLTLGAGVRVAAAAVVEPGGVARGGGWER